MLLHIVGCPPQALHDVTLIGRWGVCHDGDDTDPSRLLQSKAPPTWFDKAKVVEAGEQGCQLSDAPQRAQASR